MTNKAFEAFPCYDFKGRDDSEVVYVLQADVSVECEGALGPSSVTGLAWLAIVLYPVTLLVVVFLLLRRARWNILSGSSSSLSNALKFLWSDLKPHFYWCACAYAYA